MPWWQIASGVHPLISASRNRIEPAVEVSAPETQLKHVVLPEPFGPMSPRISPSRTSNETSARAVKPPNRFVRPRTLSMTPASTRRQGRFGGGLSQPPSNSTNTGASSNADRDSGFYFAKNGEEAGSSTGG